MTEITRLQPRDEEDDNTERLLGLAGPRVAVSRLRTERVRANVLSEWQGSLRRRAAKRKALFVTALAGAVAMLFSVAAPEFGRHSVVRGEAVAVVEHVDGGPDRIRSGESVRIGEQIATNGESRVALRFADGTSVRVDTRSQLRVLAGSAIELAAGAVYVDTGREDGRFEVRTALATARDIGTQFEVRLLDAQVRLRVRTGVVELRDEVRTISGQPGTEILLSASGAMSRPIAVHGADWEWTTRLAPRMAMDGMSLHAFLERIAREHGWTVEYDDAFLEQESARTILHGSIEGLAAADAVAVAVETSGLRHHLERGVLVVSRKGAR